MWGFLYGLIYQQLVKLFCYYVSRVFVTFEPTEWVCIDSKFLGLSARQISILRARGGISQNVADFSISYKIFGLHVLTRIVRGRVD